MSQASTTKAEEASSSSSSCSALPPFEDPRVYLYEDQEQDKSLRASSLQTPPSNNANNHHPRRWSEGCAPKNIAEFVSPKRLSLKSKKEDKKRGGSLKSRSKSLQHNGRAASYYHTRVASPYYTDHNPDGSSSLDALSESHPELITLDNMPKELGLLSRDKKSSISFSAVSFMVDTMQKLHSRITDKKVDIEKAVMEEDVDSLRTLCQQDVAAVSVAAFAAAREDMDGVLEEVLTLCQGEIDAKRLLDEVGGNDGGGLLHAAAGAGAERSAKILLDQGFDPNGWNRAATATPMHEAAAAGAVDLLKTLADTVGGDLNAGKDSNDDDRPSVLQAAVAADRTEVVQFLLERKVAKMKRGKFTETALHTACRHNRAKCAKLLLDDGVLVDAQGGGPGKRETALHLAAANGYKETMEVLLAHSADPNAKNARGETPLHQAAATLSASAMRALLDAGADVDSRDASGRPPIHFAVNSMQKGARECLQLLLDRGADIDLGDENGYTALHLAALSRRLTRVRLLIAAGADLCMRNNAGKSALHFVMKYVPNSLRTIEERLDGGLQLDMSGGDKVTAGQGGGGSVAVKMNFNLLIPSRGNRGALSEVGLFTEILQMHNNDPARLEKILMHPLSLSFLHLKWQQMKWLYYIMILFSHFVYSVTYSVYTVLIYGYLCKPDVDEYPTDRPRLGEPIPCDLTSNPASRGLALTAWIFLIIFNIIYFMKEMTKMFHLRSRYFREWESVLNLLTIASFPLITFHQNPFSPTQEVSFRAWQFHAAGVGVLVTWILQMFLIGKVPRFGKYVQMLINVGWSFFSFFVAYFALILGFSLAFVILFPREVSFTEAITAPIKVGLEKYVSLRC